ncbi:hypothetical protein EDB80DRAFT_879075 [Ilyonectria destructans]|nr:hypothetical protein EDB80DRAFT_879075 [Ilyonectria destructans]
MPSLIRKPSPPSWTSFADVQKIFFFGDSYCMTGFNVESVQPSSSNPSYPGRTSANGPNWVDYRTVRYNDSHVLSYDLAAGGSTVDNSLINNGDDLVN